MEIKIGSTRPVTPTRWYEIVGHVNDALNHEDGNESVEDSDVVLDIGTDDDPQLMATATWHMDTPKLAAVSSWSATLRRLADRYGLTVTVTPTGELAELYPDLVSPVEYRAAEVGA